MKEYQKKILETKWNDEEIIKYFIKDDGTINSIKANPTTLNFYKPLREYLYTRFSDIDENTSAAEIVYRIVHNLNEHPKCPFCGKNTPFKTFKLGYGKYCSKDCAFSEEGKKVLVENYKKSCIEKYGYETPMLSEEVKNKIKQTSLKKYGTEHFTQSEIFKQHFKEKYNGATFNFLREDIKEKRKETNKIKYGGISPFSSIDVRSKINFKEALEKGIETKRKNKSFNSSKIQDKIKDYLFEKYLYVECEYKDNKRYPFHVDFYIPSLDIFVEVQAHWTHNSHPYNKNDENDRNKLNEWLECAKTSKFYENAVSTWSVRDVEKRNTAKENNLNYFEFFGNDLNKFIEEFSLYVDNLLFPLSKDEIIDLCLKSPFPGTKKWEAANPIWDCYIPGKKSPKEAWENKKCISDAVDNMFYILKKCIVERKEENFVKKHLYAFQEYKVNNNPDILLRYVLARFTIAKIAPKVTALSPIEMLKIIDESGIDISSGVYCPMAGFGGIVEAGKRWFKNHGLNDVGKIESYDINPIFVEYYKYDGVRDVLAQKVVTDKTVIVCPPFGKTYEHWKGTPEEMSDISFKDWYRLIKEYIDAPNYIIIGPEISKKNANTPNLFSKTVGIQLWTDEMIDSL